MPASETRHSVPPLLGVEPFGDLDQLRQQALGAVLAARGSGYGGLPAGSFRHDGPPGGGSAQVGVDDAAVVSVAVGQRGHVLEVEINARWSQQLAAGELGAALLTAYTRATHAAIVAAAVDALTRSAPEVDVAPSPPLPPGEDTASWLRSVRARADRYGAELDQLRRAGTEASGRDGSVSGPERLVRLTLVDAEIAELSVDAPRVVAAGSQRVANDALAAFRAASSEREDPT